MTEEQNEEWRVAQEKWRKDGGAYMVGMKDEKMRLMLEVAWSEKADFSSSLIFLIGGWIIFAAFWLISFTTGMKFHVLLVLSFAAGCHEMWASRLVYLVHWLDGSNGFGFYAARRNVALMKAGQPFGAGLMLAFLSLLGLPLRWLLG